MGLLEGVLGAAKYGALLFIPYILLAWTYRVFFHPLRKYPGPRAAALSDAYVGWYALRKRLHVQTRQDHLDYGPVVRQGPDKLVFNSVKALHDIYLSDQISKTQGYVAGNFNPSTSNVFNTIDKPLHRFKRKLVSQLITERSMRNFEPLMMEQVDIFVKQLLSTCRQDPNAAINMSERCKWLGLDIVGHLAFGYDLRLQTDELHRFLVRAMMLGSWRINMYLNFPFLRKLGLEIVFYLAAVLQGKSFLQTLKKMIGSRLQEGKHAKHDLYSFMVDSLDAPEGDSVTLKEIWTEAIFFLPAGGDTTSTVMSSLFFYLARNPRCKAKLLAEMQSTFATGDEIRAGPQLSGCRYLRACIDEALRMSPPVGGTLWREQTAEDAKIPLVVDGHAIPQGAQVGVNIYTIHHNEDYFPDPFSYNPERWLSSEHGEAGGDQAARAAFTPFSLGARGCAGKAMAYQEASLTLAKTMWDLDFEGAAGSLDGGDEFLLRDVFTSTHDGPLLTFRPRREAWKDLTTESI